MNELIQQLSVNKSQILDFLIKVKIAQKKKIFNLKIIKKLQYQINYNRNIILKIFNKNYKRKFLNAVFYMKLKKRNLQVYKLILKINKKILRYAQKIIKGKCKMIKKPRKFLQQKKLQIQIEKLQNLKEKLLLCITMIKKLRENFIIKTDSHSNFKNLMEFGLLCSYFNQKNIFIQINVSIFLYYIFLKYMFLK